MPTYTAFGLSIVSDIRLPLPEADIGFDCGGDASVEIVRIPIALQPTCWVNEHFGYTVSDDAICMEWSHVGRFLLTAGARIGVDPAPGTVEKTLSLYLVGAVMAVLLFQRGQIVLHGSAAARGGVALAVLGGSGAGKSTLTGALIQDGWQYVSDDVLAVQQGNGEVPVILPGGSPVKLWPDSLDALKVPSSATFPLNEEISKRGYLVPRGQLSTRVPLRTIVIISRGDHFDFKPLRGHEAMMEIIRNSYPRVLRLMEALGAEAFNLRGCAQIASRTTVYRLTRSDHLEDLKLAVAACNQLVPSGNGNVTS